MFNKRIGVDLAAVDEIVQSAVQSARVPGQRRSGGNAAGAYVAVSSPLLPLEPGAPLPTGNDGFSGVDASGKEFFPFILGLDTFEGGAYWVKGYPTTNYST